MKKIVICDSSFHIHVTAFQTALEMKGLKAEVVGADWIQEAVEMVPDQESCVLILTDQIVSGPDLEVDEDHLELYLAKSAKEKNKNCKVIFYPVVRDHGVETKYFDRVFNLTGGDSYRNIIQYIEEI